MLINGNFAILGVFNEIGMFMKIYLLLFPLILLTGCFQASTDESELRTVPVTNNPNILPDRGGGVGSGGAPFPM